MTPKEFQSKPWYKSEGKRRLGRMMDRWLVKIGIQDSVPSLELRTSRRCPLCYPSSSYRRSRRGLSNCGGAIWVPNTGCLGEVAALY
ncbi:hypothetical protein L218DRAFT_129658 [Marasmius fiardii PR-910]|nr:hypothetical protein L218DRAFT_129658 [Marasmius fiardii PR-910]